MRLQRYKFCAAVSLDIGLISVSIGIVDIRDRHTACEWERRAVDNKVMAVLFDVICYLYLFRRQLIGIGKLSARIVAVIEPFCNIGHIEAAVVCERHLWYDGVVRIIIVFHLFPGNNIVQYTFSNINDSSYRWKLWRLHWFKKEKLWALLNGLVKKVVIVIVLFDRQVKDLVGNKITMQTISSNKLLHCVNAVVTRA